MIKKFVNCILILSLVFVTAFSAAPAAYAASLTGLADLMSNETVSATSSHTIRFTSTSGVTAFGQTMVITFPSGFNFSGKPISDLTLTYGPATGTEVTTTIAPGASSSTTWGAVFSGTLNVILTLSAPSTGTYINPGDKVILTYASTNSINPSSPSVYSISVNANGDTGLISVPILTNSQVLISATVDQSITFSVSNNTIGFGSLTASNTRFATSDTLGTNTEPTAAVTISAGTNATNGYTVSLSGPTLTSGVNTIDPIPGGTAQALTPGTEQFGLRATVASGTGTVAAPFNGTSGHYGFGTSPLVSQTFASTTTATAPATYNVNYAANIASLTEAGSYVATDTYAAAANF